MSRKAAAEPGRPEVVGRCVKCGNPVPGFPGDRARCKNCRTRLQLPLEAPAGWRTVADPQKLLTLPAYMVMTFYAALVALAWTRGGQGLAGGALVIVALAMWIFSIMQFGRTAERPPRWWLPVLLYHAVALVIPFCFFVGLRGCQEVVGGRPSLRAAGKSLLAVIGLFGCMLGYGLARGLTARLRVRRE